MTSSTVATKVTLRRHDKGRGSVLLADGFVIVPPPRIISLF